MNRRFAVLAACGTICLSSLSLFTRAEDPKPAAPDAKQMEAMMKAWEAFAAPGEEHKKLAEMAGDWTCKVEDFSSGQPMTSDGTCKFTMIMDGRYLMQEFTGNMMGAEFKGMGLTGYNNQTKKFQEIWIDSMGTAIYFAEGTRIDANTTEAKGMMSMPGMGEVPSRTVSKSVDKDHHEFMMYSPGMDGKEMMAVKISYTRSK